MCLVHPVHRLILMVVDRRGPVMFWIDESIHSDATVSLEPLACGLIQMSTDDGLLAVRLTNEPNNLPDRINRKGLWSTHFNRDPTLVINGFQGPRELLVWERCASDQA